MSFQRGAKKIRIELCEEMKHTIVCRCEEVSEADIRLAIRKFGARSVNEVKKLTRAGMGPCQSKICEDIVRRLVEEETGLLSTDPLSVRPPLRPVEIGFLLESGCDRRKKVKP